MEFYKVIGKRFVKGAVAGALSTMSIAVMNIAFDPIQSFVDIQLLLSNLAVAGIVGFITGGILAAEKASRWEDNPDSPQYP